MGKSAAILYVSSARRHNRQLLDLLRQAGHKVCALPGLSTGETPDFGRPQVVLLEQTVAEDLFELARSLWPQAVILRFDSQEQEEAAVRRVQAALEAS